MNSPFHRIVSVKYIDQLMICITIINHFRFFRKRLKKLAILGVLIHNVRMHIFKVNRKMLISLHHPYIFAFKFEKYKRID
ncbi:hypothetical protein BpHYR1_001844 [Brachionus plicatilis]|uniref:Uncharacterized protein n=1 Tax=Brachionus plicatilis TaxID=10195 RepID=A0A3M7QVN4_BRAPC|nr:hypothetical protein BpHYR1_001844 [Brachionus plicatilis]